MGIHNRGQALQMWKSNLLAKQCSPGICSCFSFGYFSWRTEFLSSFTKSSFNLYLRKQHSSIWYLVILFYSLMCCSTAEGLVRVSEQLWNAQPEEDAHRRPRGARAEYDVGQTMVLLLSIKLWLYRSITGMAKQGIIAEKGFQYLAHHLSNRSLIVIRNASFPV